jgi:hypothetical protein
MSNIQRRIDMSVPAWAAGLAGLVGGAAAAYTYNSLTEGEDDDEFDPEDSDTWEEAYLTKGPKKLAKLLKSEGAFDDLDDAVEAVDDFEEENPKIVRKFERKMVRRAEREAEREAAEATREAKRKVSRERRAQRATA